MDFYFCVFIGIFSIFPKNYGLCRISRPRGTYFSEPGFGFTPDSDVTLHFLGPDGSHYADQVEHTDLSGNYTHYYPSHPETAIGEWEYYAVDNATGTRSPSVLFTITP